MAERRSLFARQRGIQRMQQVADSLPVVNFRIRERSAEEMQQSCEAAVTAPRTGFPEAEVLQIPALAKPPSPAATLDMEEISRENAAKLQQMSAAEVAAAQAEIHSSLTPEQVSFLRSRGSKKAAPPESPEHTCMAHHSKPTHAEDKVKYDYTGSVVQRFEEGRWGEAEDAGLSVTETLLMARSLVPSQRQLAMRLISEIVRKRGAPALNHMITNCGLLLVLRTALDDSSVSVFAAALDTLASVLGQGLDRDLLVQRFDSLLYPRVQVANALLRSATKAKEEYVEEVEARYDNAPEDPTEEAETDLDLSYQDFVGALIKTGLLMRISYLLGTHSDSISIDCAVKVVLACALHSVSGAFAVCRTPALLDAVCQRAKSADCVVLLSVVASASHSLAITVLKLKDLWAAHVTQKLLNFATADSGSLAAWDLLDELLRYKVQPVAFEALIEPVREMAGQCGEALTVAQGRVLGRAFAVLARRERVKLDPVPAYFELATAVLSSLSSKPDLTPSQKCVLLGVIRLVTAVLSVSSSPNLSFLRPFTQWLSAIAASPLSIQSYRNYHAMDTEYSSALPRLDLYISSERWECSDQLEVSLRCSILKLLVCDSNSEGIDCEPMLTQVAEFLSTCVETIGRTKTPNIVTYRLQDFAHLTVAILQYLDLHNRSSPLATKCAHLIVPFLGQYMEAHLHYLLTKWLLRSLSPEQRTEALKHFLGLVSTSEHLQRSERLLLGEAKLSTYTLCLYENRFLPVNYDYLYQPLRTESAPVFLQLLLTLEKSQCVGYCPVHMKLAVMNTFLSSASLDEEDVHLLQLLSILADDPSFGSHLGEIKENVYSFLRFYLAASYCSPLLSRWLAVYLRPEVPEDIRKYILQETEILFAQVVDAIGSQVIGSEDRYLAPERSARVLEFYRLAQPRLNASSFYARVISSSLRPSPTPYSW